MVLQKISRAYIPKNGSIAYASWMTTSSSSSTSLINAIKYSTDNAPDISLENLREDELDSYAFFRSYAILLRERLLEFIKLRSSGE
mmetsp:Transcript_18465/g.30227  ORF Transcript_18465/g.30227 Transcript_18465/m.30227 type:complete len:86 (+) Transcript_18465:304-561(+)